MGYQNNAEPGLQPGLAFLFIFFEKRIKTKIDLQNDLKNVYVKYKIVVISKTFGVKNVSVKFFVKVFSDQNFDFSSSGPLRALKIGTHQIFSKFLYRLCDFSNKTVMPILHP